MRKHVARLAMILLFLTMAAVPPAYAVPKADPVPMADPGYGTPLVSAPAAGLVWHPTTGLSTLKAQAGLTQVGFGDVMGSANHPMRGCDATERAGLPIAPAATVAWCWDTGDATTETWIPQSVTTSGDADDDGLWGAHSVILSGWNHCNSGECGPHPRNNDARVAFIDYTNPAAPRYRWAYLVAPTDGTANPNATSYANRDFGPAKAHMGGMAWYGDKLYVSATGNNSTAIRVFSMQEILQVNDGGSAIGRTSAGYAAYGYQYVLPEIGYYSYRGGTCDMSSDTGVPCFSTISLDRSTSPDSIVAGEYFNVPTLHGRLYRYNLGGANFLLAASGSNVASAQSYRTRVGNIQGVLAWNGTWYLAHSSADAAGELWALTTSSGASPTCANPWSTVHECWGMHPESLTYNYATGMVWSMTEWTKHQCATERPTPQSCGRALFGLPRTRLP
ncbi:hypothetical protein Misp01_02980 [Microtetraspora sp. NBRC 13810]|uniref:hypothetical protein n=1 Tax=Microtetraspora sp. NBRC 13810 TaxID=3030990 RepID=UPI0024A25841|nr:hypothetical protein [Microtetraspora sp. NBRC 13810]GLW05168.1 hypothetical protein Misp01_02980 [Microtetraspora sp. NBRC 13810]